MTDQSRFPTAGELRLMWWLMAALIAIAFQDPPPDARWLGLLAASWLAGFVPLLGARGSRVAGALQEVFLRPLARVALVLLLSLLVFAALLLHISAALTVMLVGGALTVVLASSKGPKPVEGLLISGAISGLLITGAFGTLEIVLRREPLASRLGVPTEQAKWEHRYDRLWEHNAFRFRSPYEQVARTPGTARVITLGDSFTWGDKIAKTEDVWPARLERALREVAGGREVEVINMGRSGYTTANEAELLRRLGWQFQPDLVIVQFLVNDAQLSSPNFRWMVPHERLSVIPPRFMKGWLRSSAAWAITHRGILAVAESGPRYNIYLEDFREGSTGWEQVQAAIHDLGEGSRTRGTPVLLALFPLLTPGVWTVETYPFAEVHKRVAAVAREAGIEVLDLTKEFASPDSDWLRWWATPYDGHPSPEGHELAARTIAEFVVERRLLQGIGAQSLPGKGGSLPPQKAVP